MSTPLRRLCHWGPIAVLGIIKLITWSMIHLMGMWWPPHESLPAALHAAMFLILAASTLYFFLQALLEGPGFVPSGWKPENEADKEHLQYCTVCEGFKAPRSHHCRKCGHCIKKMDHHCPWINCCVGHANHCSFTMFLIAAVLGCLHASIVLIICLYHAINRVRYVHYGMGDEPLVYLTLTTLLMTLLATGMAVGVVLAVGALLYLQIRSILRNCTTIEDWIIEKAQCRRKELGLPPFQFPYDLGWKKNVGFLLRGHKYDGIKWPLLSECGEYDLTEKSSKCLTSGQPRLINHTILNQQIEQLAQKQDKHQRSRIYTATRPYSGRWAPILSYPRAALAPPCSDEARLPLELGDVVRATRRRRHWLFGEKLTGTEDGKRGPRGWFPRDSAAPAIIEPPETLSTPVTKVTPVTPANNKYKHD